MLYNRLSTLKSVAGAQASDTPSSSLVNPLAVKLGLNDAGGPSPALMEGANPAAHFYEHLLDLCEKLFDNEIDQAGFEENMRHMYGTKAYVSFTLDKLIAAIVKQVRFACIFLSFTSVDVFVFFSIGPNGFERWEIPRPALAAQRRSKSRGDDGQTANLVPDGRGERARAGRKPVPDRVGGRVKDVDDPAVGQGRSNAR